MANEVKITVTADDRASATLNNFGTSTQSMFAGVTRAAIGFGAVLAGREVLGAIVNYGQTVVQQASNASESLNKLRVVYGDQSAALEEFSASSARSLGLSTQITQEYLGTFGNLLTSMGMTQNASAGMSTNIVKLAADLASFNNLAGGVPEALEKIRAGLVGEAEPLRTLGVNLNQAAIEQEAMRLGLMRSGEELNAANKAQAAYSLILQQTKNAQGDFARTSDGLANTQRSLTAAFADLGAKLGAPLVEPAQRAASAIASIIDKNGESWANGFAKAVNGLVGAFDSLTTSISNANRQHAVFMDEARRAGAEASQQGGFAKIRAAALAGLIAGQGGATGDIGTAMLVGITKGYNAATDFIDAAENVAGWVPNWIEKVKQTELPFQKVGENIASSAANSAKKTDEMAQEMQRIQDKFLTDQVEAYIAGGDKAVAEVKASQQKILAEALTVAQHIADTYGVKVSDVVGLALDELTQRSDKLAQAAKAASQAAFDLTTQLWRQAGGSNMSAQSAQGLAAIAQAATMGLSGYTTAEGKFIATGGTGDITKALEMGLLRDTFGMGGGGTIGGTTTVVNVNAGVIGDPAAAGKAVADAINKAANTNGPLISAGAVQ